MATGQIFGPELFTFLRALKRNNDRAWFEKNKARYVRDVKEPMQEFIRAFQAPLKSISPHLIADPRPVGGSMFRIHRDTRFSKDKSPYKTHAAAHFRHDAGKDVHAPGYYLHLEPGEVFLAGGLWRPETEVANRIRRAIVANAATWKQATKKLELGGETLARPPRGFPADHPLLVDLKRKDFIASVDFSEKKAVSRTFVDEVADAADRLAPMMEFLAIACGFGF